MNLHQIAGPIVSAVNPWIMAQYQSSLGNAKDAASKRAPIYADPVPALIQMQPLTADDLAQLSGLNIQSTKRAMYLDGDRRGTSRPDVKGGDILTLPNGSVWLVISELENWAQTAGWTKIAVVQQKPPCC